MTPNSYNYLYTVDILMNKVIVLATVSQYPMDYQYFTHCHLLHAGVNVTFMSNGSSVNTINVCLHIFEMYWPEYVHACAHIHQLAHVVFTHPSLMNNIC